jgi:heme/copper-type cytochrome/quinol oxidase subunit 4
MPYCPKCGNKVDDNMTFCSRCGAPLKAETTAQPVPAPAPQKAEKNEKGEKQEKQEKGEKHEKRGGGFIGFLIAGLVLAFLGIVAYYDVTTGLPNSQLIGPAILLIIGIALVVVAIYYVMKARSRNPQTV